MLTIDGTATTPRQVNRAVNTPVKVDDGIPAELRRVPQPDTTPIGAGMIFLRRSGANKHWVYMFTGIKHVQCGAELDVPVPCGSTLRDVLAWLGTAYAGKLGGAWLLVAP